MPKLLWTLPHPSTAVLGGGPAFLSLGHRRIQIAMFFENDHDTDARLNLEFEEVEAYKCTYYSATETSMLEAYDRLVDLGSSEWLQVIAANVHARGGAAAGLSHLMIMFDDGPCYEIVCRSYRVIHDASHTT